MEIKKILNSYYFSNSYLIKYKGLNIVIDPGNNIKKILELSEQKIDIILLTHGHMDHIYGVNELVRRSNAKVYASYLDDDYLKGKIILDYTFPKENYLNDYLDLRDLKLEGLRIIRSKGHSKGSVCFYFESEKVLFSGDTLFKESFGRYDFIGGNANELVKSIKYLFELDDDILVYPGHGEMTNIKSEKLNNYINNYF